MLCTTNFTVDATNPLIREGLQQQLVQLQVLHWSHLYSRRESFIYPGPTIEIPAEITSSEFSRFINMESAAAHGLLVGPNTSLALGEYAPDSVIAALERQDELNTQEGSEGRRSVE